MYTSNPQLTPAFLVALLAAAVVGGCTAEPTGQVDLNAPSGTSVYTSSTRASEVASLPGKAENPRGLGYTIGRFFPASGRSAQALQADDRRGEKSDAIIGSGSSLRQRLVRFFMGYEVIPVKADLVRFASRDVLVPVLMDIATDTGLYWSPRLRALACLRFFPGPDTRTLLEDILADAGTPHVIRRPAVSIYGQSFGAEALARLQPLLSHGDLHTRNAAVLSLARLKLPAADKLIQERWALESAPSVRRTIQDVLVSTPAKPRVDKVGRQPRSSIR